MAVDNSDDLIISISTDQATLRRSIKRIEQDLGTLAGSVKRQFDNVGKTVDSSLTTSLQNRINAMTGVGVQAAKEWTGALADQGKELERLRARYSPLFNTINNYKAAVADIRRAHAVGAITSNEMAAAISRERQAALAATAAIKGRNAALADTPAARNGGASGYTSNIAAQFQDIGVTAYGGMSPLTIALQQGTQLSAVFNDLKAGGQSVGSALTGAFASVLSPVSLVTIGLVAGSAALLQYAMSATKVKTADEILKGHAETVALLKDRYGEAAAGLRDYVNEGMSGTVVDIRDRLKDARAAIVDAAQNRSTYSTFIQPFVGSTDSKVVSDYRGAFIDLRKSIRDGEPDLLKFREAMARIADNPDVPEKVRKLAQEMREFDPEVVKVARSIPGMVQQIDLIEGTADRQALAIGRLTKALRDLSEIGVPALDDIQKVDEAYQRARSNATTREDRDDADAARRAALKRLDDRDPTITNSDGNTTNVPIPGQKPITLGDKPDAETKKQETAAQRAANAYRDLKKSADDRIAQMQMETALLGKFGVEADAARFALDLLQQSEDKGRSLNEAQRKELAQKVELYRQYSEQLAKAKLQQDLLEQRRYNSMSAADQQVYTTLKQYGLSTDLNSKEAGQIRQSQQLERQNEAIDQFAESLSNGIVNSGGDIGKAFGEVFLNELKDTAQKQLSNVLGQLFKALLTGGGNGSPIGSSATSLGGGLLSSVFGGGSGKTTGGAVDLAGGLLGKSETANRGQINTFLKAGGVDLDAAQQAWCAGFVNSSLAQIGVKGSGSSVANSFQNWGSAIDPSKVIRGDVLLQDRGLGAGATGGHVGFATGQSRMTDGGLQLQMLSGNSGNAVSTTWVNAAEIQAKRATEAANALASVADSSKVATQGLGQLGQLSTSFFPSAPSAPSGGGFGSFFSGLFGGGLSAAQIAKYSPMVGLFADGGDVRGPGSGTSDSIPAMLSDGEFVVNAASTKKHRALLHAINNGRIGRFATGGLVGGGVSVPVAPSLRSGRSAANNNAPGVMVIHLDGANGDDHVMALAKQAVTDGLGQYNKNQERGGFGTVQGQFTKRKG